MQGIFVLGAGRAGRSLASALAARGAAVLGLHGRTPTADDNDLGIPFTTGQLPPALGAADIILVTVRDSQLDAALKELLACELMLGATVLHASGSAEPAMLSELRRRGHPAGTFHPLVPLTDSRSGQHRLQGAWIGIDGDAAACVSARELAAFLDAHIIAIPVGGKGKYHAAAVLASNFPCVLAYLARELLSGVGIPEHDASAAVVSLMHASVENLRGRDPADALTGPVVRGDAQTVALHLQALCADDAARKVYTALSGVAVEMSRRATGNTSGLAQIESILHRDSGA